MEKSSILHRNERYNRMVDNLFESLAQVPEETLNRKPANGGWSAIQTMHHLLLTEELSLAYVRKKLGFQPQLAAAGPGARWRGFLLWAYLSTPVKFKAPKNVGDDHLPAYDTLSDTRARWEKARAGWTDFFQNMPEDMAGAAVYKHPRAGRLGWPQMLAFFETHFNRHVKQVKKAIAAVRPVT